MSPAGSTPNLLSPNMPKNPHHWSTTHLAQLGNGDVNMRRSGHSFATPPPQLGYYTIGHPHHHYNRYRQPANHLLMRSNLQHTPSQSQGYVHMTSPPSMGPSRDSMQQRLQAMLQQQSASHLTHPSYPVYPPQHANSYNYAAPTAIRSRPSFERATTSPQRQQSLDVHRSEVVSVHPSICSHSFSFVR